MNPILLFQNWYRNASPQKKRKALLIGLGCLSTLALMITTAGGDSAEGALESTPLFFIGVAVKLSAVLLLIVGGSVMLKRWYGGRSRRGPGRQMHLVESIRLSPKQALHVVEVGGQQFLIGATDQTITMLSNVEIAACGEPAENTGEQPASTAPIQPALNFGDLFSAIQKKPAPAQPAE
jgi:flagellar biosynthetic protein FliO